MMKRKIKINKRAVIFIVTVVIAAVFAASVFVADLFLPVRYVFAYINFTKDYAPSGSMRVRFLDVGYGDCTLVEFPNGKTLLADAGDGSYLNENYILKVLNKSGIDRIDYLVCTSVKDEHCRGLAEILEYKNVGTVYMPYCIATDITSGYRSFCGALADSSAVTEICEYGEGYFDDECDCGFCFLSPSSHFLEDDGSEYAALNKNPSADNINNASAVMWVYCGDFGFLLLSDAGKAVQQKLVEEYTVAGGFEMNGRLISFEDCKVIKIANHGNINCVYSPLYDLIKPDYTVLSTHKDVPPSSQAVSDAQRYSEFYRTDCDGTITFTVGDGECAIVKEKK